MVRDACLGALSVPIASGRRRQGDTRSSSSAAIPPRSASSLFDYLLDAKRVLHRSRRSRTKYVIAPSQIFRLLRGLQAAVTNPVHNGNMESVKFRPSSGGFDILQHDTNVTIGHQ